MTGSASDKSSRSRGPSSLFLNRTTTSKDAIPTTPGRFTGPRQRMNEFFGPLTRHASKRSDAGSRGFEILRERELDFTNFLDLELDKIESFYRQKEEQASKRLEVLKEQLQMMKNRRIDEIAEARRRKKQQNANGFEDQPNGHGSHGKKPRYDWMEPLRSKLLRLGPGSQSFQKMENSPVVADQSADGGRDYVRQPISHDVSYRTAKKKLKLALQEFYRGLELLKSYALLNRTAFRKLNKKYDKAVNARPHLRYMNERVNKSWFVNSGVVDSHLEAVEDLYARYFERSNHKVAVGKLRATNKRRRDHSEATFRSGVLIGLGAVFTVQGLTYGAELLFDSDAVVRMHTSYLLQIYGGYFLMLYLFSLFCLNCWVWTRKKINYPFIFEFDPRPGGHLNWKELAEFPCIFFALFGITMWLNFSRFGSWEAMYLYWPVALIVITTVMLFFPAPIFRHKARLWLLYSHYRLFFAGLYPVEFRDFFLGDIWCSLTYAACNVELFFCLYANKWDFPDQCNSTHSRLMGFFAALPPFWRALQCLRRYRDTQHVFPHLVNCGKYTVTILSAVSLSLFRLHGSEINLCLFIFFSVTNSIYCSIWDLFMDFSLLQCEPRHRFLRDIIALKSRWLYYVTMIVDPILRFAWIFYALFTHGTQHSTVVSFLVAFCEVSRRGIWIIFRVENEHCANAAQYKASRDIPLPYQLEPLMQRNNVDADGTSSSRGGSAGTQTTGVDVPGVTSGMPTRPTTSDPLEQTDDDEMVRRRRADAIGKRSIRRVMAEAHKQDFEKKKPKEAKSEEDEEDELGSEDENEVSERLQVGELRESEASSRRREEGNAGSGSACG